MLIIKQHTPRYKDDQGVGGLGELTFAEHLRWARHFGHHLISCSKILCSGFYCCSYCINDGTEVHRQVTDQGHMVRNGRSLGFNFTEPGDWTWEPAFSATHSTTLGDIKGSKRTRTASGHVGSGVILIDDLKQEISLLLRKYLSSTYFLCVPDTEFWRRD